jgi:hypothetical protein
LKEPAVGFNQAAHLRPRDCLTHSKRRQQKSSSIE